MSYKDISWTKLEASVAIDLKVDEKHVRQARKIFDQEGYVIVTDTSTRGRGSANYNQSIYKPISIQHLTAMVVWVDKQHSMGETVTNITINLHIARWTSVASLVVLDDLICYFSAKLLR